jgi:hypothetical protein
MCLKTDVALRMNDLNVTKFAAGATFRSQYHNGNSISDTAILWVTVATEK